MLALLLYRHIANWLLYLSLLLLQGIATSDVRKWKGRLRLVTWPRGWVLIWRIKRYYASPICSLLVTLCGFSFALSRVCQPSCKRSCVKGAKRCCYPFADLYYYRVILRDVSCFHTGWGHIIPRSKTSR